MQELPIIYTVNRKKPFLNLLGSIAFVSTGIIFFHENPVIALMAIIFFGLGCVVCITNLLPKASYLSLTTEGFEYTNLFRKHFEEWKNVESFIPAIIPIPSRFGLKEKIVGWNYKPSYRKNNQLRKFNKGISGAEAGLPDTYNISVKELCEIMNEWCTRYGKTTA